MALADILKILTRPSKQPQSAAALEAALAAIDLKALEAEVDRLEVERRKLLIHGSDAEIAAIGAEITAANLACERASAAADELKALIVEAVEREKLAAIDRQAAEAQAALTKALDLYVELDETATRLAELLDAIRGAEQTIRDGNAAVVKAGRHDLRVQVPIGLLQQITGLPAERLPDISTWRIGGYVASPGAPPLPADRRFGRLADIAAISLRKAA